MVRAVVSIGCILAAFRRGGTLVAVFWMTACATAAPMSGGGMVDDGAVPLHRRFTPADVDFMQGMIVHHRQALDMTALVAERTDNGEIHLLAERIEVSQMDEIAMMSGWLESRGEVVPAEGEAHAHHGHGNGHDAPLMAGMLTPAQMAALAATRGAAFDRLFLESMIEHHLGALLMVDDLFASPGAGQEVEVFRIASEVDSDQRIEIERMERMLRTIG